MSPTSSLPNGSLAIHPIQIALRTYALTLSLSLGPSLVPFIAYLLGFKKSSRISLAALKRVLRRELSLDGFAFCATLAVGGGATLQHLWYLIDDFTDGRISIVRPTGGRLKAYIDLSETQKTFISNVLSSSVAILLLQAGRRRSYRLRRILLATDATVHLTPSPRNDTVSPTLDLTLLLLVRAIDSILQMMLSKGLAPTRLKSHLNSTSSTGSYVAASVSMTEQGRIELSRKRQLLTSRIDAFVFWACSARIMWCFFYEPQRLPRSYVKWISTLASVDKRLLRALQLLRVGGWSYLKGSPSYPDLLTTYARDLGHPMSWGDPKILPAYGGSQAGVVWEALRVNNRHSIGGLPCEMVHGGVGSRLGLVESCAANTGIRGLKAFVEAIALYLPVHFIPILLKRPKSLLQPHLALVTLISALRSASFLSAFVASYWYAVCFTRTLVLARLLPFISHDFWDGPFGCIMAGCLTCGSSIWIENGRRRGEMALYVLPRAIRACLPDAWVKSGNWGVRVAEQIAFVLSVSTLLTAAVHRSDSLRGIARWALAFMMNGPNTRFWKRKRQSVTTPSDENDIPNLITSYTPKVD